MNKKIFIIVSIIFLLTGFFNNSIANSNIPPTDSLSNNTQNNIIQHQIIRNCKDSIIQDLENKKIFLYGEASISYGDIKIYQAK